MKQASDHGDEQADEGVEQQHGVQAQQLLVGRVERLEVVQVAPQGEEQRADPHRQVYEEGPDDHVHEEHQKRQEHDRRRAVQNQTERLNYWAMQHNQYILDPSKREFNVIISGPTHSPMKMFVNASSDVPSVLRAASPAVTSEMIKGPHRSHSF